MAKRLAVDAGLGEAGNEAAGRPCALGGANITGAHSVGEGVKATGGSFCLQLLDCGTMNRLSQIFGIWNIFHSASLASASGKVPYALFHTLLLQRSNSPLLMS